MSIGTLPTMFDWGARVIARFASGERHEAEVGASGSFSLGALDVDIVLAADHLAWRAANQSATALGVDSIRFEWREPAGPSVRMFSNGYQSWSPTGGRRLGTDEDPSRHPGSLPFVRAVHHADPVVQPAGALRSELVAVVDTDAAGDRHGLICVGFDGGSRHSGTVHLRAEEPGAIVLGVEAWLGGAVLPPGTARELHGVRITEGDDAPSLLDAWASFVGANERARVGPPYLVGWCSWYYYFHQVSEAAVLRNLGCCDDWPFDLFQLDDGFQPEIGDWLTTNDRFPNGVDGIASAITARGVTAGLWLAPFIASPASAVANAHPQWFAREPMRDAPLMGMFHPEWGGVMWGLDTTRDDVLEHLTATARQLVEMGYRYLKLDFTFSAAVPGRYCDPTRTPAERVRAGYEAVRRGAGEDATILACGCPLGAVVGIADAMRVGPDVAPWWAVQPASNALPGYEHAAPSTRNAWVSTLGRSFMHRRLWSNDPDCIMLRTDETELTPDAARAWAYAAAMAGGLALVSDDLTKLGPRARALLDEVIMIGRAADGAAQLGPAPRCDNLLERAAPALLVAGGARLHCDPDDPKPRIEAAPVA
jgi:alpha-galactosidase